MGQILVVSGFSGIERIDYLPMRASSVGCRQPIMLSWLTLVWFFLLMPPEFLGKWCRCGRLVDCESAYSKWASDRAYGHKTG